MAFVFVTLVSPDCTATFKLAPMIAMATGTVSMGHVTVTMDGLQMIALSTFVPTSATTMEVV
jgi:hypothetical protein